MEKMDGLAYESATATVTGMFDLKQLRILKWPVY